MNSIELFRPSISNPVVTIAIPTYKRGDLLVECVESALNQINFSLEYDIIVVDNNPDRADITENAMEKYRENPQVGYFKNEENVGMIGNWNRLYDLAKGRYVVILHDDDMLYPFYLQVFFSLLKSTDFFYDMVYPSHFLSSDRTLRENDVPTEMKYRVFKREDYIVTQWGLPSGMMILKDKFIEVGRYTNAFFPISDQEFIYRALGYVNGCVIYYPLIHYYIGVNETLKFESMRDAMLGAMKFNKLIRNDKRNRWHFFAYISYRNHIWAQLKWNSHFTDDDTLKLLLDSIGFKKNKLKDYFSFLFVKCLKKYLNKVRIHNFQIDKI